MEEPIIPPAEPTSEQPAKKLPVRLLIIGGVIIALLVALVLAFIIRIDGYTLLDRTAAQNELRDILVADRSFESVDPQSFGLTGLVPKSIGGVTGTIGDYAASAGTATAIVTSAETAAQEVWLLGSEPRVLATGAAAKASLAVSGDGALVAYAARADGDAAFAPTLSAWTVHLVNLSTGRDIELGTGFDPEFFERDGVSYILFTTPGGVVVNTLADLDTIAGFITPLPVSDSVDHAVKISPDGKYIAAKDPTTRQHTIYSTYRVTANMPLGIEPLMYPANRFTDIIFTKGAAYGLDNLTQGVATVWKIDLETSAESKRYTFSTERANRFIR